MISKLFYWYLDYFYVFYWQVLNLFVLKKANQAITISDSKKPTIVIIPGVYEKWFFMKPLVDYLKQNEYTVYFVDTLGYNRDAIPEAAARVKELIESNDLKNVIIVAHSKGGLIGKYFLTALNSDDRVRRLVTINTPFAGSIYASFFFNKSVRDFSPNSWIIKSLQQHKDINNKIVSIYGIFDPHIPGGSHIDGAKNIQVPVIGHFRLLSDKLVQQAVLENCK